MSVKQADRLRDTLEKRAAKVDKWLDESLECPQIPQRLRDSMLYSLTAPAKRLRPVLCLTSASLCGIREDLVLPFAGAIEMIHTYSLIHDDLPAMDDDDLRRGRPSNHKAFDEATAILAGDGLLTDAFGMACSTEVQLPFLVAALKTLALAAGSPGMVGGQVLDMLYTGKKEISIVELRQMQNMKTGKLIEASCICGALLAGADEGAVEALSEYGTALGAAFQIADDILDVTANTQQMGKPAGSDEKSGKNTWPALIGLQKSRDLAWEKVAKAKAALERFSGNDAVFLRLLANYTVERTA